MATYICRGSQASRWSRISCSSASCSSNSLALVCPRLLHFEAGLTAYVPSWRACNGLGRWSRLKQKLRCNLHITVVNICQRLNYSFVCSCSVINVLHTMTKGYKIRRRNAFKYSTFIAGYIIRKLAAEKKQFEQKWKNGSTQLGYLDHFGPQ
jgi:hypothetical protein